MHLLVCNLCSWIFIDWSCLLLDSMGYWESYVLILLLFFPIVKLVQLWYCILLTAKCCYQECYIGFRDLQVVIIFCSILQMIFLPSYARNCPLVYIVKLTLLIEYECDSSISRWFCTSDSCQFWSINKLTCFAWFSEMILTWWMLIEKKLHHNEIWKHETCSRKGLNKGIQVNE